MCNLPKKTNREFDMKDKQTYKELEDRIELLERQLAINLEEKVSENFLSKIINQIGDPIFVKDDQSRLILVNDAFCNIFDLPRENIMGKTLAEDVPDDQREHFLRVDNQVLADGKESNIEELLKVRGGEMKTIITKKSRYIDESGNKLLIGVIHDITSNKRIEAELIIARDRAEESDTLKSAFLANVSHEIRTPMNSILGFSDLLKKDSISKEKTKQYLDIIESSGKRLLRIISDIIDLSKIDTSQLSLAYENCNLNKLIDNLEEQFNLCNNGIKHRFKTSKGLSDSESVILVDQDRLAQILSNLIENSIKYAPDGNISFGYEVNNELLSFYVKDEGIGIDLKNHNLIFNRFSQINNEYLKSTSGTGLGLSIVKELTELMKGKIWVESELGKGATFYFSIPYQSISQENDQLTNESTNTFDGKEKVILIAEDEFLNYLYLKVVFENYPFKLIHAKNGEEAITLVKNNSSIDLVLMDIKMPKIDGINATIEIRKSNKNIPIIALSAHAFHEDKQRASSAGFNDYLSKPVNEKTLLDMVDKYINGANST